MKNFIRTENNSKSLLRELILNDSDTKVRIGFKEVEERVLQDEKDRKINAPLTTEEKILLSQ